MLTGSIHLSGHTNSSIMAVRLCSAQFTESRRIVTPFTLPAVGNQDTGTSLWCLEVASCIYKLNMPPTFTATDNLLLSLFLLLHFPPPYSPQQALFWFIFILAEYSSHINIWYPNYILPIFWFLSFSVFALAELCCGQRTYPLQWSVLTRELCDFFLFGQNI